MSSSIQLTDGSMRAAVLHSVKYDGSLNYHWPVQILWEDAGGFVWSTPAGAPFTRPAGVSPTPYDWVGRVWYDHWYMVDASLMPATADGAAGVVHHYYCNLGAPGEWQGDAYRFVDLDLDVVIYPDGRHLLLDEDEFAAHTLRFGYPADVVAATRQAVQDVLALARSGAAPFDGILADYHAALHDRTRRLYRHASCPQDR